MSRHDTVQELFFRSKLVLPPTTRDILHLFFVLIFNYLVLLKFVLPLPRIGSVIFFIKPNFLRACGWTAITRLTIRLLIFTGHGSPNNFSKLRPRPSYTEEIKKKKALALRKRIRCFQNATITTGKNSWEHPQVKEKVKKGLARRSLFQITISQSVCLSCRRILHGKALYPLYPLKCLLNWRYIQGM